MKSKHCDLTNPFPNVFVQGLNLAKNRPDGVYNAIVAYSGLIKGSNSSVITFYSSIIYW